jgi:hypothetical protein
MIRLYTAIVLFKVLHSAWWWLYIAETCSWFITYLLHGAECEKVTDSQLINKFPAFYGTRRFISAFTSARHLSLSWASSIQSISLHPTSWRYVLILSSHTCLGLPSGLFPSGFPTKTLYTPLSPPIRATCPAHLILLDAITQTILGEEHRSLRSSLCSFLQSLVTCVWTAIIILARYTEWFSR